MNDLEPDFSDLAASSAAVISEIARVVLLGNRRLLLAGPPGTGKTVIARRINGLLGPLAVHQVAELRALYRVNEMDVPRRRPFRAPHHSVSTAALCGPRVVGELEMSRYGVLFLDELIEFTKNMIESLKHRLNRMHDRDGTPVIVASCNPCPCGFYGSEIADCKCTDQARKRFDDRLRWNLDALDIRDRIVIPHVPLARLASEPRCKTTSEIAAEVTGL